MCIFFNRLFSIINLSRYSYIRARIHTRAHTNTLNTTYSISFYLHYCNFLYQFFHFHNINLIVMEICNGLMKKPKRRTNLLSLSLSHYLSPSFLLPVCFVCIIKNYYTVYQCSLTLHNFNNIICRYCKSPLWNKIALYANMRVRIKTQNARKM